MKSNQKIKLKTEIVVNNVSIQRPVINYILPSGEIIALYDDARHDKKHYNEDAWLIY